MTRYIKHTYPLLLVFMTIVFHGCVDDGLGFSDNFRDGETTVSLEASFSPFSEGDLTRASGTDGKILDKLNDLCILVYDKDGILLKDRDGKEYINEINLNDYTVADVERDDTNASNGASAETTTKSVNGISLTLPFGEYYIVAVANIKGGTMEFLQNNKTDCNTLDGLRGMKMEWDSSDIANNGEMLGYFASENADPPRSSSSFQKVQINRPGIKLRAWLRRCASKITIDFDGSGLRENIYVYIKEARIYDITKNCTLGFGAASSNNENETDYNNSAQKKEDLLENESNNQSISYLTDKENPDTESKNIEYISWPCITKGDPYLNGQENFHNEDANALYFYENMQGDLPEGESKIPHFDINTGSVAGADIKKDGKEFGTYIEVVAHYKSNDNSNLADYDIKYRFMIGKDVTVNCDAERNYHYKLTLRLRGNGNDYDWHIDYNEEPGFDVPNPWYVSYLYNHDATLPFKYIPPEGYEVTGMKAEITENPWYPTGLGVEDLNDSKKPLTSTTPSGDNPDPYKNPDNRDPGNGFLSLRQTDKIVITDIDASGNTFPGYNKGAHNINNQYYTGANGGMASDRRIYMEDKIIKDDAQGEIDKFSYKKDGEKYSFSIPLFTRAKIMVKQTGYSGNNPFVGYQRVARVKITATIRKIGGTETLTKDADINVVQVRRVVNPKGVYRKNGNFAPFHVRMMYLSSDEADAKFEIIKSRGPWKAEIIGDANFITLDGKQTTSGSTGSDIDFNIRFNRMSTGNKNAVVRIKYHNYTCTHLIFVRQGYAPQDIAYEGKQYPLVGEGENAIPTTTSTTTKWNTFNMISKNLMASDPRDEGSLFKFGNSEDPIDAINNAYSHGGVEFYTTPTDNEFIDQTPEEFQITDENGNFKSTKKTWSGIKSNDNGFDRDGLTDETTKTATVRDFEQLYLSDHVQFGYGVLYADGATETQSDINMAYGWYRRDTSPEANEKGMRGVFAYYWNRDKPTDSYNGRNIFFPIGRSGFGHRKQGYYISVWGTKNYLEDEKNINKGILRYASTSFEPKSSLFSKDAPLFVSLYRKTGAVYWARNKVKPGKFLQWNATTDTNDGAIAYALDFNYFTFDVNVLYYANTGGGQDACFVRTVTRSGND